MQEKVGNVAYFLHPTLKYVKVRESLAVYADYNSGTIYSGR